MTIFILFQLYAFFFEPNFNQSQVVIYQNASGEEEEVADYNIKVGDFVPTVIITTTLSIDDESGETEVFINDRSKFDFYFNYKDATTSVRYEAILCTEYIDGEHWADKPEA